MKINISTFYCKDDLCFLCKYLQIFCIGTLLNVRSNCSHSNPNPPGYLKSIAHLMIITSGYANIVCPFGYLMTAEVLSCCIPI